MLRAGATAVSGLGVTFASTFASSLGLSVAQERIGFVAGVLLTLVGVGLFAMSVWPDRSRAHILLARRNPIRLKLWLRQRLDEAAMIASERSGRQEYVQAMNAWDTQNVNDLLKEWPERVRAYRAHPHDPPYVDGPPVPYSEEEDIAYFDRRLDWLTVTLREHRRSRLALRPWRSARRA